MRRPWSRSVGGRGGVKRCATRHDCSYEKPIHRSVGRMLPHGAEVNITGCQNGRSRRTQIAELVWVGSIEPQGQLSNFALNPNTPGLGVRPTVAHEASRVVNITESTSSPRLYRGAISNRVAASSSIFRGYACWSAALSPLEHTPSPQRSVSQKSARRSRPRRQWRSGCSPEHHPYASSLPQVLRHPGASWHHYRLASPTASATRRMSP